MKKRRLRYDRISLSILALILIFSFFLKIPQIMSKNKIEEEVVTETNINKIQENETKVIETDPSRLCGLSSITCEEDNFDEITLKIKKTAEKYEVDWKLVVAIARLETGNYTSYLFINKNNVGGNYVDGEFLSFATLEAGIDYFVSNLKRVYIDEGKVTLEEMQPKYAPIGAENDPNGSNKNWLPSTIKIYKSL